MTIQRRIPADPNMAPSYLFDVPIAVLRGTAHGIEAWCAERGVERPTLLHLGLARDARSSEPRA